MKIRKGDTVIVIKGDDKGKTGRVLAVDPDKRVVFVQRVRLVKRHQKPRSQQQGPSTGITEKEAPIPVANVALVDPKTGKPTRVRKEIAEEAEDRQSRRRAKVRISVRSGVEIERPTTKA